MANITITYQTAVKEAVSDIDKVSSAINRVETEANQAAGAQNKLAASTDRLGDTSTRTANKFVSMAQTAAQVGAALFAMKKIYDTLEDAAKKYDATAAAAFARQKKAVEGVAEAMLTIPIAGRGVLRWIGDALAAGGDLLKLEAALAIKGAEWVGLISEEAAAHAAATLAASGHSDELDTLKDKIDETTESLWKYQDAANTVRNSAAEANAAHKGNLFGVPTTNGNNPLVNSAGLTNSFGLNGGQTGAGITQNVAAPVTVNVTAGGLSSLSRTDGEAIGRVIAPYVLEAMRNAGLAVPGTGAGR